jgi:lipoyl(octanoyl) transferase
MSNEIIYNDLGLIEYGEAWKYQEKLFEELLDAKSDKADKPNHLLFCEHPHVFTLGKSGSDSNLLINNTALQQKGVSFFRTNRGGDITYHGPGQIVGYPILNLEAFGIGIRAYIELLEEAIIILLSEYGIAASRLSGASGTWLDADTPKARKICAIGVRSSRYVTMHGFAFNVNTDLSFYDYINPCGFVDKGVTSMQKELGAPMDFQLIKGKLKDIIISLLRENQRKTS